MRDASLTAAEHAIQQLARQEGKTVEQVRRDMEAAIRSGMSSSDPTVQAYWKRVPHKGETPTAEEVVAFLVSELPPGSRVPWE